MSTGVKSQISVDPKEDDPYISSTTDCHESETSGKDEIFARLFGMFRSTRELFTHMKMSPLHVKGCNF